MITTIKILGKKRRLQGLGNEFFLTEQQDMNEIGIYWALTLNQWECLNLVRNIEQHIANIEDVLDKLSNRILEPANYQYKKLGYVDVNLLVKMSGIPRLIVLNVLKQCGFIESGIPDQFIKIKK